MGHRWAASPTGCPRSRTALDIWIASPPAQERSPGRVWNLASIPCKRLPQYRTILDKYNCTEEDAKQLCQRAGLLSPVYTFTTRGGCWFCPNAKRKELRHLYDYHPNLWERMLELQALPNKVSEKFNRSETFSDIDAEFRLEDAQESLFQNAA